MRFFDCLHCFNKRASHFIYNCRILQEFFAILCNITESGAIILTTMVGVMAKIDRRAEIFELVIRARMDADALGQLYELHYERIFRFCVHRLFNKEIAEDVTSTVFLTVARQIRSFTGRTEADFRNWLYAIAANQANAYIRKTSRREKLLEEAACSTMTAGTDCTDNLDWPTLYKAILKLKPKHQTIVALRFFDSLKT